MGLFKRKKEKIPGAELTVKDNRLNYDNSAEPVLVVSIVNPVSSGIFQDILKENNIPFICRQNGAGGCIKVLLGGGIVPDEIYVAEKNAQKARELYEVYLNTEAELESEPDEDSEIFAGSDKNNE